MYKRQEGKETSCKGYHVQINKDSLIAFLRTSSDFFLNDEEMKKQYLDQLRLSISMAALFSGSMENGALSSAEEMVQQNYDEIKEQADWMIQILEQSLQDIDMMVYVDPKGRLAGLTGTTTVVEADMDTVEERREAQIEFALELQGGNYLTENMNGRLSITSDGATMDILYEKAESYDKERLDSSCKVTVLSPDDENITMNASGTYIAESGDCQLSFELLVPEMQPIVIHGSGVVTELEKGKSIYADIDAMSIEAEGVTMNFSGELGYGPLSGEVLPLEGEDLDVLVATEEDWGMEYLDYILSVKQVDSVEDAIEHINRYNTGHSEAIITKDYDSSRKFLDGVDAAAVYVNASTRFTDGFEFGFGAEIGISTQKLHARGPMGLKELTTTKYIIYGSGQVRP